jgi:hypothetical protein
MCTGLVLGSPAHVDACSLPPPWTYRVGQLPQDGATHVPTNVQLALHYESGSRSWEVEPTDPILRLVGGEAVELEVEVIHISPLVIPDAPKMVVLARPTTPLEPTQTYELLDRIGDGACAIDGECDEHVVIATFETGAGPDEIPPTAAVISETGIYCDYCYEEGLCCHVHETTHGYVRWNAATDDGAVVTYDVYADGNRVGVRVGWPSFTGPVASYRIDSVDAAGNVTVGTAVPAPEGTCEFPGPERDGGAVVVPADGGAVVVPADGGTAASSSGGGCSTVPGPPAALPGWILALFALAVWPRSASRRRHDGPVAILPCGER